MCVCERGCMSVCVPEGLAFSRSHPLQLIQPRLLDLLYSWPPFYSRRSWGGKYRAPICTWRVNLRDRDTRAERHVIFMTVKALCVSVSNHTLTIEMGRYHQQWLPKESRICPYCTQRQRESVCTSVRGGAPLDPFDTLVAPHEPSHMVGGQG